MHLFLTFFWHYVSLSTKKYWLSHPLPHPHRPDKSLLQGHFCYPWNLEINIKRNSIKCSCWATARSGPHKPVRQSITGSGQPRGVLENVGACCCGHCPWARGPRWVPPDGGLSGGRLQLFQEVVQGWDALFQAFALAHLCHHLTGAAGVVKGVTGQVRKAFLSLLAILWNSAFGWVYLFVSPLPFTSLLFSAICKASSDNYFALLHFFFLGMVLITASCTMSQTSVHSSSGTVSIRSNPLNLFVTSTV